MDILRLMLRFITLPLQHGGATACSISQPRSAEPLYGQSTAWRQTRDLNCNNFTPLTHRAGIHACHDHITIATRAGTPEPAKRNRGQSRGVQGSAQGNKAPRSNFVLHRFLHSFVAELGVVLPVPVPGVRGGPQTHLDRISPQSSALRSAVKYLPEVRGGGERKCIAFEVRSEGASRRGDDRGHKYATQTAKGSLRRLLLATVRSNLR